MSSTVGNCDFCESTGGVVIDCGELAESFESLFNLYINHPTAVNSLKKDAPILIHEHIATYWPRLFNIAKLKKKDIKQLVRHIGQEYWLATKELFESPVEFSAFVDKDKPYSNDLELQWDSFAKGIKHKNRFFLSDALDLDVLESTLLRFAKTYPAGHVFYRARISDKPLECIQLSKPPVETTTPGRANPVGIPYLYVSDSEQTTLYETRIALHESISIGQFVVYKPLQVISLKNIADYGPFEVQDMGFTIDEFIEIRPYLIKLEDELSKPVRKQDVHLDYLPTQFLCEYIKSKGFDAIEYRSAMNASGYNLAIFNDDKLECVNAKFYQVQGLKYKWV
ncbi:RES domain-containing protein [Parapedobacter tibetensis]|uniref:RES domain-containing protein n=1 Tax=Parapedobacter tibetensis TaxID=2972951 RepID=UPI00214D6826|nr:RES domain-containing protein [Parapedobacter tibetensis]